MKPSRYLPLLASAIAIAIPGVSSQAQISVSSVGSPQVITFDSNVAGTILTGTATDNATKIVEPNNSLTTAAANARPDLLVTTGASGKWGFANGGAAYNFGADSNNDSDTTDALHFGNVIGIYRPTDNSNSKAWDIGWGDLAQLSSAAFAISRDGDFATGGLYLRIQNNTGAAVNSWSFAADAFYKETSTSKSTFTWGYAVTNTTNISGMSFTSLGATPTIPDSSTLATARPFSALNVATPSVANGDFLVLAFEDVVNGNGSTILLDNISIAAVPEPARGPCWELASWPS